MLENFNENDRGFNITVSRTSLRIKIGAWALLTSNKKSAKFSEKKYSRNISKSKFSQIQSDADRKWLLMEPHCIVQGMSVTTYTVYTMYSGLVDKKYLSFVY